MAVHICKSYILSCEHCGITEGMILFKLPGHLGYRCRDSNGEQIFKARRGLFGDKTPEHCPVCNGRLKQEPGPTIK